MDFCEEKSRTWLAGDFAQRQAKNAKYSVRAYARAAGVNSGAMSQVLSGKRKLTRKQAEKIADALMLDRESRERFLGPAPTAGREIQGAAQEPYRVLKSDVFRLIADWYHYGILSLLETDNPPKTSREIALRLGIDHKSAREGLSRLIRLGMVYRADGQLRVDTEGLRTTEDIPNGAIRQSHRQILAKAARSLDEVPVDKRDSSYISFCCDPRDLPQAKKLIRRFRRQFTKMMERGAKKEVYAISINLFPLSQEASKCPSQSES
jgi:transcriptional regulator with XRE-family HTH domain